MEDLENETLGTPVGDNLTGRAAATVEGITVTYLSLFLMALGPILVGSIRSVSYHSVIKVMTICGLCVVLGSNGCLVVMAAW